MTRHFSYRNITWAYAVVQDCQFYLFTFEGNFKLHMYFMVRKIKGEINIAHKQNLKGRQQLNICPLILLLIYLADHCHVMEAGSAVECILTNNFTIKVIYYYYYI
jgi:hypothetical protein